MNYAFVDAEGSIVRRSDGAYLPWSAAAGQPADIEGAAAEAWISDGRPAPASYVPPAPTMADVARERDRRLALGFEFDFGAPAGKQHVGTTPADLVGWDDVSKYAAALLATGDTSTKITIATDSGTAEITAAEWQQVLLAAAAFRQPIWQASFVLAAMSPIPGDFTNDKYWPSAA